MDFEQEKVTSVETYLEKLPALNQKMEGGIFYRGQSNINNKLMPSVLRGNMLCKENEIYTEIMTECSHEFEDCKLHNEILSKMQHYGVPTRLLDVTTNPLVALYFACDSDRNKDKDGVVFVIKTDKSKIKQYDSDVISILASLPRFDNNEKKGMLELAQKRLEEQGNKDSQIKKFNKENIIRRLLHEIKKEKPAFENIINPADILNNYYFLPRKKNVRIIRQSGAFIIFGLKDNEIKVDANYLESRRSSDVISYRIIIENNRKDNIIEQLACFGISKATLHPELYKVAEYINARYL